MTHDANRCLCEECLNFRAAQKRRNRRRGLRDLAQFSQAAAGAHEGADSGRVPGSSPGLPPHPYSPAAVDRDAAAGDTNQEAER